MILAALLDATPLPPDDDDVEVLLHAFDMMRANRQQLLDRLIAPIDVTDADRELARQIADREAAWAAALGAARDRVGQARVNATKLRGYAPARGALTIVSAGDTADPLTR